MSVSMKDAVRLVRNVLDENHYRYRYDEDKHIFLISFNLNKTKLGSTDIRIMIRASSEDPSCCQRIMSYGGISMKADQDCMAQVCEFLTRANYGLALGNFEMDLSDGEILYKVGINAKDALPGDDAVDDLTALPVAMFNRYGNGLLSVMMGMCSAEEAIRKIEG